MTVHEVEDDAFLPDMADFLRECDALEPPTEFQVGPDAKTATTDLLLDSHELIAETEALLATYSGAPHISSANVPANRTPVGANTTHRTNADQRREIKNAQAAKRRLKYRAKLKNERQTLKDEEKSLSEELKHMQHARKKAKSLQERSITAPVWKAIATRQMEGRLVAEEQQRLLKKAVGHRSQLISRVSEMVQQRLYGSSVPAICVDTGDERKQSFSEVNADDVALFEDFLQDLDAVYSRTDDIFQACGLEEIPMMPYRLGPRMKQDGDKEHIENLDVLLLPFNFEQTCSAMWKSMVHVHRQQQRHQYAGIIDPENTFAVKFHLHCPREQGDPVEMTVHLVMRRYLEAGRMVIIWRALSEGEGEFGGKHSDETGWCVVRANDSADEDSLFRTVMQTFVRFIPMNVASSSDGEREQFTKLVVASVEEDAEEIARMMDSLLLDVSRGQDGVFQTAPVVL
ncbi:hypothetical protein KRP22_014321 [Phytophthora ramorum]|uniref:uncharacterized protein n=1 Tax=Phytophthora ramorum TaxID=164328 RepID=UPI0030951FD7|nr:hypothetical protein KRP23_12116 [Phytophthora ramorum]KAH7501620.1 hypothetical protein KRP22_9078 [Phytophthora ramorum]